MHDIHKHMHMHMYTRRRENDMHHIVHMLYDGQSYISRMCTCMACDDAHAHMCVCMCMSVCLPPVPVACDSSGVHHPVPTTYVHVATHADVLLHTHATTDRKIVVSYRIAWHRIASHRIASHHMASHGVASHRIASHGIAWHRITSHGIASHAQYHIDVSPSPAHATLHVWHPLPHSVQTPWYVCCWCHDAVHGML